jgi:hypothetical protein
LIVAAVTVAFPVFVFVAAHNVSCKSLPRCRRVGSFPDPRLDRQSLRLRWIELPPHVYV